MLLLNLTICSLSSKEALGTKVRQEHDPSLPGLKKVSATFVINTSSSQYHDFNSTLKIGTSSKYLSHDSGV